MKMLHESLFIHLLSRLRPAKKKPVENRPKQQKLPDLDEYLIKKDYAGATSLLEDVQGHFPMLMQACFLQPP
uniref:Transposase n=1 Tax=Heterorhabditis bacteriophora TaxID=37862 RepID=A0A1I7XTQ4_HETBA